MQEESIYNILQGLKDDDVNNEAYNAFDTNTQPRKKKEFVLPTASTFINSTTCRPGVCNLSGNQNPLSILQNHKGMHATFGKPKGAIKSQTGLSEANVPNRVSRGKNLPPVTRFDYNNHMDRKPAVPKENEAPIYGLNSNTNFISQNRQYAMSLQPKLRKTDANFLEKQSYGRVPSYINKVKNTIQKEIEYLNMIHEAENRRPSSKYELQDTEKEELKKALAKRYAEVNKEYQGITHMTKITSEGLKRKKENCEKQLAQIEKDMQLLSKEKIVVNCNY